MTKVAVVGSREYPRPQDVWEFVGRFQPSTVVISGGARGVDRWAVEEAQRCALTWHEYKARWMAPDGSRDRNAGYVRNTTVVANADHVVAFWDGRSSGTLDTIVKALDAGKLFRVYVTTEATVPPLRFTGETFAAAFAEHLDVARKRRLVREGF